MGVNGCRAPNEKGKCVIKADQARMFDDNMRVLKVFEMFGEKGDAIVIKKKT